SSARRAWQGITSRCRSLASRAVPGPPQGPGPGPPQGKERRMADRARRPAATKRERVASSVPPASAAPHEDARLVCNVAFCPFCLAVTAAEAVRPEVVQHLLAAGQ